MKQRNIDTNTKNRFKDTSLFTRWVNQADQKDKGLSPTKRKGKWTVTLAVLFILFGLSFIWFPPAKLDYKGLKIPRVNTIEKSGTKGSVTTTPSFEMPVDSFEQHLKQKLHENIPERP